MQQILIENNFNIKEEYDLIDYYLIKKDYNRNLDNLETLNQCVLLRNIVEKNNQTKLITYKYKEYAENGDILKQGKTNCKIESIEDAQKLFEAMGYFKIIEIKDHLTVYTNNKTELAVQEVNNKHIYIEIENKCDNQRQIYSSIDEMKQEINKYKIPIKTKDYFVKKAAIELEEQKKQ